MKKMALKKIIPEIKLSDTQLSINKQHEQTYNRARVGGSGLCSVGPFTKDDFPLLKLQAKNKEYFVRADKWMITRYYIDEYKTQVRESYFYPSKPAIDEFERVKRMGSGKDNVLFLLYEKLVSDGMGTSFIRSIPKGRIKLKKQLPRKLKLQRKTGRIKLRRI